MLKKPKWKIRGWLFNRHRGYDFRREFKIFRCVMPFLETLKADGEILNQNTCDKLRYFDTKTPLVINAVSTDPFSIPISHILNISIDVRLPDFIDWLILLSLNRKVSLIIDNAGNKNLIKAINKATYSKIDIYPIPAIYPQDHPIIAAKTVFGGHIKSLKKLDAEIVSLEDILRVCSASRDCQYANWSMLSLNFRDSSTKQWQQEIYSIYGCGEKFSDLLAQSQSKNTEWLSRPNLSNSRVVVGGLLTGRELKNFDEKLTPDMSPIIIIPEGRTRDFLPGIQKRLQSLWGCATTNLYGEERECVNCGWCDDICPVRLNVEDIYRSIEQKRFLEAERLGLHECIDCGLCVYICPSKIEILEQIKIGKKYKQEGTGNV